MGKSQKIIMTTQEAQRKKQAKQADERGKDNDESAFINVNIMDVIPQNLTKMEDKVKDVCNKFWLWDSDVKNNYDLL